MSEIDIAGAVERINAASDSIIDQMLAVSLDPKTDFAGGDWRNCHFEGLDLRNFDFRNCRLHKARFERAQVAGADFQGSTDLHLTKFHQAVDWRKAKLDEDQIASISVIEKMGDIDKNSEKVLSELVKLDSPLNPLQYLSLIRQTKDFESAYSVLQEFIRRGMLLDDKPYVEVMQRCESRKQADALLDEFLATGLRVTGRLIVAYCHHLTHWDQFRRVFELMKTADDCNPNQIYNLALKQANGSSQVMQLIEEMRAEGFKPDSYTLHEIFVHEPDFDFRMAMVRRWHAEGLEIGTFVLNELLFSAHEPAQFAEALPWFEQLDQPYDEFTHGVLISRAASWDAAKAAFARMIDSGIKPQLGSVKSLLRRAGNFKDACEALVIGRAAGVNIHDYNLLSYLPAKTGQYEKSKRLMRDRREEGRSPAYALRGIVNGYRFHSGKAAHNKLLIALGLPTNGEVAI